MFSRLEEIGCLRVSCHGCVEVQNLWFEDVGFKDLGVSGFTVLRLGLKVSRRNYKSLRESGFWNLISVQGFLGLG